MYFDRRQVGFGTWQIITFTLYFLFVRVQKFEDSQFTIRPLYLVNYFLVAFYISFYHFTNSVFLFLQISFLLTFYLKKLGLNDIFGMRREPNRRRIKRRHAQKKICIPVDEDRVLSTNATPSNAEFNDLYKGCENLQVICALQKQKSQCKT